MARHFRSVVRGLIGQILPDRVRVTESLGRSPVLWGLASRQLTGSLSDVAATTIVE